VSYKQLKNRGGFENLRRVEFVGYKRFDDIVFVMDFFTAFGE
jgi:hypothetical protein